MSTRSKTKALAVATAPVAAESSLSSNGVRTSSRIRRVPASKELSPPDANQDNGKRKTRPKSQSSKAVTTKVAITAKTRKKAYCLCKGPDDGSPMVQCSECKDWYHLACVNLSEKDAKGIKQYVCPPCAEQASSSALAEAKTTEDVSVAKDDQPALPKEDLVKEEPPEPVSESEPSSEDDYVAESEKNTKIKKSSVGKRTVRRLSLSSESSSDGEIKQRNRVHAPSKAAAATRKGSVSPPPSGTAKRKHPPMAPPPPQPKRKRAESNATDDATRKYCLGKLQEIFSQVFLKYPHIRREDGEGLAEKKPEELTEKDREQLHDEANKFATELEQCVFELYAEPDKIGQPSAGGKYKERFRMLNFNLSKPDRVVLHKRIVSLAITPKEISVMSSTDLANEETKQHIKIAEKESLEHSILQKTKVPLAKITHKGLQEIEDLNGSVRIDREIEREQEEEQRREHERIARLRTASMSSLSKPQGSVPPESPVVPHTPLWSGPPPLHAVHPPADSEPFSRSPVTTLFPHTAPEFTIPEPELNLDEFINIDEDPSPPPASSEAVPTPTTPTTPTPTASEPPSTTGISPFAANAPKADTPSRTTFDLNALWTAPKTEVSGESASSSNAADPNKPSFVDRDLLGPEADDQDFDMFLEKDQDDSGGGEAQNTPEAQQATFNALPQVWSGMINMPLDSTIPQETRVVARQMGGRPIASDSPLWRTLFPSEQLRIDGRVPVDKSSQFLLQTRMNPTKELICVSFSPASESSDAGFRILTDFLIAKSRHGLVFPWGNRPKEHHPGKELYIIPLLSSDPLPDYMELLDDLRLPNIRKSNYLIGIWVLNKGKLAPPVPQMQPSMASLPPNSMPLSASLAPVPAPPPLPLPPSVPLSLGHIAPATLAAEVASLTPEQIQLMLQTLASATAPPHPLVVPPLPVPTQPSHLSPPHVPPPAVPANPPQPWQAHPPPLPVFPIPFQAPPPPPPQQPPPPPPPPIHGSHQPPYPPPANYDRNDRDEFGRDYRPGPGPGPGPNYGGGGGDRRGRGRGRGRRAHSPLRPVDSGWPRNRIRSDNNVGEGSGGPGGPSSPSRSRWGESWD